MSGDRVIAQVVEYADLIACVRARVAALDVPLAQLEEHMGLTPGLLGKFVGVAERRRIGLTNVCDVLEGLGYRMMIIEHLDLAAVLDEMADNRPRKRQGPPRGKLRMTLSPAIISASAACLGAMGGNAQKRFRISDKERSKINRRNARKRQYLAAKATKQHVGRPA